MQMRLASITWSAWTFHALLAESEQLADTQLDKDYVKILQRRWATDGWEMNIKEEEIDRLADIAHVEPTYTHKKKGKK